MYDLCICCKDGVPEINPIHVVTPDKVWGTHSGKEGSSAGGVLGVLGSDETVAEESIVAAPNEDGIALSCAMSGV